MGNTAIADRILSELDGLAENWSIENRMSGIAANLAAMPDEKRTDAILAMLELAFSEGYYQAAVTRPAEQEWGG